MINGRLLITGLNKRARSALYNRVVKSPVHWPWMNLIWPNKGVRPRKIGAAANHTIIGLKKGGQSVECRGQIFGNVARRLVK